MHYDVLIVTMSDNCFYSMIVNNTLGAEPYMDRGSP